MPKTKRPASYMIEFPDRSPFCTVFVKDPDTGEQKQCGMVACTGLMRCTKHALEDGKRGRLWFHHHQKVPLQERPGTKQSLVKKARTTEDELRSLMSKNMRTGRGSL